MATTIRDLGAIQKYPNQDLHDNLRWRLGDIGITQPLKRSFAEGWFSQSSDSICRFRSDYRVISICVHPGVYAFNGFYALDG